MTDIEEIKNIINQFANAFDTKKWHDLSDCLNHTIKYNYNDLRNSNGQCSREEYVAKRKDSLSKLTTQHIFGNIEVIDIQQSYAQMQVSAVIFRKNDQDICFNTHAIYLFGLKKVNKKWLITEITQTVLWNEGDKNIHPGITED